MTILATIVSFLWQYGATNSFFHGIVAVANEIGALSSHLSVSAGYNNNRSTPCATSLQFSIDGHVRRTLILKEVTYFLLSAFEPGFLLHHQGKTKNRTLRENGTKMLLGSQAQFQRRRANCPLSYQRHSQTERQCVIQTAESTFQLRAAKLYSACTRSGDKNLGAIPFTGFAPHIASCNVSFCQQLVNEASEESSSMKFKRHWYPSPVDSCCISDTSSIMGFHMCCPFSAWSAFQSSRTLKSSLK